MNLDEEYQVMLRTTGDKWFPVTPVFQERPSDGEVMRLRLELGLRHDVRLFVRKWEEVKR